MKRSTARFALVAFLALGAFPVGAAEAAKPVATSPERSPQGSDWWSSLWRTADQRGERLLQQGDAAGAAGVFADPRRKAHAEFLAGRYAEAADNLAALDDGEAHYNRGNALAHAGRLKEALGAFDKALARDPSNADARHNRALTEEALKRLEQQAPPPEAGTGTSERGKGESQSDGEGPQEKVQKKSQETSHDEAKDGQRTQDDGVRDGAVGKKSGSSTPPAGPRDPRAEAGKAGSNAAKDAAKYSAKDSASMEAGEPAASQPSAPRHDPGSAPAGVASGADAGFSNPPPDDAGQARRDVASSLAQSVERMPPTPAPATVDAAQPVSEKQLAQQHWLRSIPDDPGGLLRRKFLIEHLMRQQKSRP